jgi:membrane protein DedA with SNARE-associated domain
MLQVYLTNIVHIFESQPLILFFVIILLSVFFADITTVLLTSFIVETKQDPFLLYSAVFISIYIVDLSLYLIGKKTATIRSSIQLPALKSMYALYLARFIPGLRFLSFVNAGRSGLSIYTFSINVTLSSFTWTGSLILFTDFVMNTLLLSPLYRVVVVLCALAVLMFLIKHFYKSSLAKTNL